MQKYSEEDVLKVLRELVDASGLRKTAASLGFSFSWIGHVLNGRKRLNEDLALRLGFVKMPDAYVKAPKKK
jgi:hypothetical protein